MVTSAQAASRKELAAERYRYASTLLEDLESVPKLELDLEQYQLVIDAFRRVHRTTPASGYCDDALYSVAKIYGSMIDRFEDDSYRERAIEAYRFMARQYPHSKWRNQALEAATKLENGGPAETRPGPRLADPAPAVGDEAAVILTRATPTTTSKYQRRTVIEPPNRLAKNSGPASIIDIRHHSENGATRIVLTFDNQIQLKYDRLERPERLYFDLLDARVSNDFIGGVTVDVNNELVKSARLAQNRSNKARLVLDLNRPVSMDLIWLDNPARLAIDIRDPSDPPVQRAESTTPVPTPPASVAAVPAPKVVAASYTQPELATPKPADTTSGGKHNLIRALGLKMSRIVIDPGHGGHDTGSIGRGGLREKDVALDIAHRLGDLLEERLGADVIYTRTTDEFISLNERPRIANSEEADLFISIHCNSVRNRTARGVETYYLNFTTDSWALNVASRENAASSHSIHELQDLVSKIALKEKIEESKEFATKIQAKLHSGLSQHSKGVPNRGVRKAPFVVLIGAKMPAVLAEIGFISNKSDEALMRTDGYRAGVAEYLFDGIASYAGSLGTLSMKTPEKGTATAARLD
jgi:N-acetylmuramoyl-L-alanine amidase